jgi:hypothetical protein
LKAEVIGKDALTITLKEAPKELTADLDKLLAGLPDTITDVVDYDVKVVQEEVKHELVKNKSPTLSQAFSVSAPMTLEATVTSGGFYDGKAWGSTGVLALIIDGQYYYDMSNSSWWSTAYEHRIEITVDNTNVDADLTDFPVYLNLSASSGITSADVTAIFDELGANSLKIVVANFDNTAQFYTEVVSWDSVGEIAELWTAVDVDDATDTTIYLYYDVTQADNSSYVGVTGSVPGKAVWDANFVMVMHMNDTTTSTITGSTSLNAAGVKKGANEPVQAAGGVGKTQDFDGTDDLVTVADSASLSSLGPLTVESYFNQDVQGFEALISKRAAADPNNEWNMELDASGRLTLDIYSTNIANRLDAAGTTDVSDTNYHYAAGAWDGVNAISHISLYLDGVIQVLTVDTKNGTGYTPHDGSYAVEIGRLAASNTYCFDGKIAETRISNIARSAAWIKATNYSLKDDLVTFGTEETYVPSVPPNYLPIRTSPFRIKSANWLQIEIRWPNISTATEYMLRVQNRAYPTTTGSGYLVYQGTAIATLDFKGINKRYTLFYKEAGSDWQNVYRGHY